MLGGDMRRLAPLITLLVIVAACYRGTSAADSTGTTATTPSGATSGSAGSTTSPTTPGTSTTPDTMSTASISIRTDRSSYRATDPVTLTIVNGTGSQYFYNPCTRILERESSGAWTEVKEDRMCTMIAHVLDARATRTETTELGDGLAAGRYRIVVAFTEETPAGQQSRSVRAVTSPISVSR